MAFCSKCGTKVEDGVKFCPGCGNVIGEIPSAPAAAPAAPAPQQAPSNDFSQKISSLNETPDTTAQFDQADIGQNKLMAVLAYLSWLVIIPILAAPKSKFARFHSNQGLVLAITEIVWWIATAILNVILYAINWRLGSIVGTLLGVFNIVFFVLTILGIINAANGKAKELPIIGKIRILK